jgi:hypothetical protein
MPIYVFLISAKIQSALFTPGQQEIQATGRASYFSQILTTQLPLTIIAVLELFNWLQPALYRLFSHSRMPGILLRWIYLLVAQEH